MRGAERVQRVGDLLDRGAHVRQRGGDLGCRHDVLGEGLRAFKPGRGGVGPKHGDPDGAHRVRNAGHQRGLGANHHEIGGFGPREACDGVGIVRIHAHVAPHRGRARIARSDDHLGAREGERTGEGVLTGTGADDEDLHGHQAYRGCIKARPPPSSGASLLGRFLVRALRQRDHVEVDANSTSILGPL